MTYILSFIIAFGVAAIAGQLLIPLLHRLKAGQAIRTDGPTWHMSKQGTPTMGGIMFIIAIGAACLMAGWEQIQAGNYKHLYVFLFALVFGVIGMVDDFQKLRHHANEGLTAAQKFLLQLAAAIAFTVLMRGEGYLTPNLFVPFLNAAIPLPWVVYMVFAAFVMVGTVNAVNLTDGIDGQSSSVTFVVMVFFTAAAVLWRLTALALFPSALAGGLAAFFVYNHHPAKTFMGDTGSLFLGGAVAALAFAMDMPLILIPVGIIYIVETLSDIIQVTYFKATHGKRFFKMAPIHHHLERCGWSEAKIVTVFSAVTLICCVLAYQAILGRH